jgi:hypothetical protein
LEAKCDGDSVWLASDADPIAPWLWHHLPHDQMSGMPSCDAIEGRLLPSADDSSTACFYPNGLRLMAFTRSVPLEQGQQFNACLHCGHVWSRLSPDKLRKLMERSGKPQLKV